MEYLLDEKIRLGLLFGWLLILCAIGFVIPLVSTYRVSVFKTIPNIVMTLLLVIPNFIFSSVTFYISIWDRIFRTYKTRKNYTSIIIWIRISRSEGYLY